MEAYYLSFTNKILFPHSEHQKGLQRYSKDLNLTGHLTTNLISVPFKIHSIDVTLCPYGAWLLNNSDRSRDRSKHDIIRSN